MLKIDLTPPANHTSYSEISQLNPMRWICLKNTGPDEFKAVSREWRCKDFMNEVVASFQTKKDYLIYGFRVDHKDFFNPRWSGLPLLLKNCSKSFEENVKNVLNPFLAEQNMPPIEPIKVAEGYFVNIPEEYLKNTLFISTITLLIRMVNTNTSYRKFEDVRTDPLNVTDSVYFSQVLNKPMGQFPKMYNDYIYVGGTGVGKKYGDVVDMVSTLHCCGVNGWVGGWAK